MISIHRTYQRKLTSERMCTIEKRQHDSCIRGIVGGASQAYIPLTCAALVWFCHCPSPVTEDDKERKEVSEPASYHTRPRTYAILSRCALPTREARQNASDRCMRARLSARCTYAHGHTPRYAVRTGPMGVVSANHMSGRSSPVVGKSGETSKHRVSKY